MITIMPEHNEQPYISTNVNNGINKKLLLIFYTRMTKYFGQLYVWNKRAERALGRSPEEKVKGHSGAIYREPLMLYTKNQGSSRFLQEDFQDFYILLSIYKNQYAPRQGPILY